MFVQENLWIKTNYSQAPSQQKYRYIDQQIVKNGKVIFSCYTSSEKYTTLQRTK